MTIEIIQVTHTNKDLHDLISKLDEDLLQRYPSEEIFTLDFQDPEVGNIVFMVAYVDGIPAGCGAIKPLDDYHVELKRFYVSPDHRRKGLAAAILNQLENRARELHYPTIRLECGAPQPEAVQFYEKHGYYKIARYGEYMNCESSLCYEKVL